MTRSHEIGIPIIDIGDLRSAAGIERIAVEIRAACRGIGFFYITNHPIPDGLLAEAFEANRHVHRLPEDEKQRIEAVIATLEEKLAKIIHQVPQ